MTAFSDKELQQLAKTRKNTDVPAQWISALARELLALRRQPIETGWLVEKHENDSIQYLWMDELGFHWTPDSLKACRFSRRVDAEMAADGGDLMDLHIVEHQWSGPSPPDSLGEPPAAALAGRG